MLLGYTFFGLPIESDDEKYQPSYRSLVSYIIRKPNSLNSPFTYFQNQKGWQKQIYNTFFLGLDWQLASKWQHLKDRGELLKNIAKGIREGVWEEISGSLGELEAEKIRLQEKVRQEESSLANFKVLPQYRELQDEVDGVVREIQKLNNTIISNKRKLSLYNDAVAEEVAPDSEELESIYEQVGIIFPEQLRATLVQAKGFYENLIRNRKSFLGTEISKITNDICIAESLLEKLSAKKTRIFSVLQTHGALEEFMRLQTSHLKTQKHLEDVISQLDKVREIRTKQREITQQKSQTEQSAMIDYEERRPLWEHAIKLFNDSSEYLYERPGKLIIDITSNGYSFDINIERSNSTGIEKMKIFCYDLMLVQLSQKHPDFLIHDSAIFDGVDARQRAMSLELAAEKAKECSFQYICMLNTDMVPYDDFSDDFDINSYVRITLEDNEPQNSLLGKWY